MESQNACRKVVSKVYAHEVFEGNKAEEAVDQRTHSFSWAAWAGSSDWLSVWVLGKYCFVRMQEWWGPRRLVVSELQKAVVFNNVSYSWILIMELLRKLCMKMWRWSLSYNRDKLGLVFLTLLKSGHKKVNLDSQSDWSKKYLEDL